MKNQPSKATLAAIVAAVPVAAPGLRVAQVHARTNRGAINSTRYGLTILAERGELMREWQADAGWGCGAWLYRRAAGV